MLSDATVVNFGKIGCGTVYRNFESKPTELARLPTRIFGIGMHKTATTSLALALETLGFDTGHWKTAHWAKAIWREMNNLGRSSTLENDYALCDLPIPLLYRKLDAAYPGSKFILTVRDDEAWLNSVEAHWDTERNPYRSGWDNDPFTNHIHDVMYRQREFDRTVWLNRYQHHNRDVLAYFKDRPNDLLVMNISAGSGWDDLCGFLNKPIPAVPYPRKNSSR